MKKARVVYLNEYCETPLSFWVHRPVRRKFRSDTPLCDPPLPAPTPGLGWLQLIIEFDRVHLRFSSSAELDHFIDVLSRNPLPTTRRLSELRGTEVGPNGHWLSRLPSRAKPLGFRRRLVAYLQTVRPEAWE